VGLIRALLKREDRHPRSQVLLLGRAIRAVVLALDLADALLHLANLPLPLLLTHLALAAEQLVVGLAVAAAQAVPERGVLAVVVVKVEVMPILTLALTFQTIDPL
jgi:hypothetical protein